MSSHGHITDLPPEILYRVGDHLPYKDIKAIRHTSSHLRDLYDGYCRSQVLKVQKMHHRQLQRLVESETGILYDLLHSEFRGRFWIAAMAHLERSHLFVELSERLTLAKLRAAVTKLSGSVIRAFCLW